VCVCFLSIFPFFDIKVRVNVRSKARVKVRATVKVRVRNRVMVMVRVDANLRSGRRSESIIYPCMTISQSVIG
jgi:hypothetical protein